jgi:hypothetical protein
VSDDADQRDERPPRRQGRPTGGPDAESDGTTQADAGLSGEEAPPGAEPSAAPSDGGASDAEGDPDEDRSGDED